MGSTADTATSKTVRTSVSVPAADHAELERLAERKKVSIAWIIRDAIDQYLTAESPLFRQSERSHRDD